MIWIVLTLTSLLNECAVGVVRTMILRPTDVKLLMESFTVKEVPFPLTFMFEVVTPLVGNPFKSTSCTSFVLFKFEPLIVIVSSLPCVIVLGETAEMIGPFVSVTPELKALALEIPGPLPIATPRLKNAPFVNGSPLPIERPGLKTEPVEKPSPLPMDTPGPKTNGVVKGAPFPIETPGEIVKRKSETLRTCTIAVPSRAGNATLTARIVTLKLAGGSGGPVYSPVSSILPNVSLPPSTPLTLQLTD